MKTSFAQFLLLVLVVTMTRTIAAGEAVNAINVGIGGLNPMPHCDARVYSLEYEHRLTPTLAIIGQGTGVNYTSDEGDYLEDGILRGLDLGARYYSAGRRQGYYTGGSLGYWKGEWTFIENRYTPQQGAGEANTHSFRVNVELGYRFPLGDTITIAPEVNLGKFFSSSSCDYTAPASRVSAPCDQQTVVNDYIFAGMILGVAF